MPGPAAQYVVKELSNRADSRRPRQLRKRPGLPKMLQIPDPASIQILSERSTSDSCAVALTVDDVDGDRYLVIRQLMCVTVDRLRFHDTAPTRRSTRAVKSTRRITPRRGHIGGSWRIWTPSPLILGVTGTPSARGRQAAGCGVGADRPPARDRGDDPRRLPRRRPRPPRRPRSRRPRPGGAIRRRLPGRGARDRARAGVRAAARARRLPAARRRSQDPGVRADRRARLPVASVFRDAGIAAE